MKFQKRDKPFRDIVTATAKERGVPISQVEECVEFYFRTTAQLVAWDKPVTIHMNYIGDLAYNQKWADKVKELAEKNEGLGNIT